jgi:hypothetical protein
MGMPDSWGTSNVYDMLYHETGWTRIVFFDSSGRITGIDSDGKQTGTLSDGWSPVCALSHHGGSDEPRTPADWERVEAYPPVGRIVGQLPGMATLTLTPAAFDALPKLKIPAGGVLVLAGAGPDGNAGPGGLSMDALAKLISHNGDGGLAIAGEGLTLFDRRGQPCGGVSSDSMGTFIQLTFSSVSSLAVPTLTVGGPKEVHINCDRVHGIDLQGISLFSGASLSLMGESSSITLGGLMSLLSYEGTPGEGSVTVDPSMHLTVRDSNGQSSGTVTGSLPGIMTLRLDQPLIQNGATGEQTIRGIDPPALPAAFEVWNPGSMSSTSSPVATTFTLYKLPPHFPAFSDDADGARQYGDLCESYGLHGIGSTGSKNSIAPFGGMPMPPSWGNSNLDAKIYENTGWTNVAFFEQNGNMYGVDDTGIAARSPGDGYSPLCAMPGLATIFGVEDIWHSGPLTSSGKAFTLFKMPPQSQYADTEAGVGQYQSFCARYGLLGVGHGGLEMPQSWGTGGSIYTDLFSHTGWTSTAFYESDTSMYGINADGNAVSSPETGYSPICGLAH